MLSVLDWTHYVTICRKEAALRKKREDQEKKEAEIKRKYLEKQEEENRRTAAAERRIRDLEQVEREMIERLKKTQTLQQKVSTPYPLLCATMCIYSTSRFFFCHVLMCVSLGCIFF